MLILLLACAPGKGSDALTVETAARDTGTSTTDTTIEEVGGSDEADGVFDPETLHEVRITIAEDDWDTLRKQSRSLYEMLTGDCLAAPWEAPYTWFEAVVSFDDEDLGTVGIRKKGLLGSDSRERPSLRLDLDRVSEGARFHGLQKIVLNNNNQDWSRVRSCLAHQVFADAGLVAPRCSLARVWVNGEDLGIYDNAEALDEELVERVWGAPPTTLYEGRLSDLREGWLGTFEAKNEASDGADLAAVVEALDAEDEALPEALDAVLDLDGFLTFWAVESLTGHWDGYNGNTNNYYVYGRPDDGRLAFFAGGPDATFDSREPFGSGQPVWVVSSAALSNRLISIPEMKERYTNKMRWLLDEVWDEDARLDQLDRWKALTEDVMSREERRQLSSLRSVVAAKAADIEDGLGSRVSPPALRGVPCLSEHGTVRVDFRGSFGSYPDGDLYGGGEASVAYELDGVDYESAKDGVSLGWYDGDYALFLTISEIAEDTWLAPYVILDAALLVDGAEIPLDGFNTYGYLLLNSPDTGGEWAVAAYLGPGEDSAGTLSLDEAGSEDGDVVAGSLDVSVLSGE